MAGIHAHPTAVKVVAILGIAQTGAGPVQVLIPRDGEELCILEYIFDNVYRGVLANVGAGPRGVVAGGGGDGRGRGGGDGGGTVADDSRRGGDHRRPRMPGSSTSLGNIKSVPAEGSIGPSRRELPAGNINSQEADRPHPPLQQELTAGVEQNHIKKVLPSNDATEHGSTNGVKMPEPVDEKNGSIRALKI